AFSLLPFPTNPPPNYSSLIHYLVGGSGGGGGGCMPLYGYWFPSAPNIVNPWAAGAGGSGGGGAFALRAGGSITVTAAGSVEAKGGAGAVFNGDDPTTSGVEFPGDVAHTTGNLYGLSAPGGGGSGGTVLLQADGAISMLGSLNTSGGNGSSTNWTAINPVLFPVVRTAGGAGATGNYHLESNNPVQVSGPVVPPFVPAVNQGPLNDRDDQSGCASLWRGTGLVFPPQWLRYEIDVDIDGDGTVDRLYTDDASIPSFGPAVDPLGPLVLNVQGARVSTTTGQPLPGTVGPWR